MTRKYILIVILLLGIHFDQASTSTNIEGETTAAYIAEQLGNHAVKTTRIASGVPIGGDLKYVDQVTLKKAMETRHAI